MSNCQTRHDSMAITRMRPAPVRLVNGPMPSAVSGSSRQPRFSNSGHSARTGRNLRGRMIGAVTNGYEKSVTDQHDRPTLDDVMETTETRCPIIGSTRRR